MGTLNADWTVEIEAPIAEVWAVAADVPSSPIWQPALKTVETIESDAEGRATLVDTTSDAQIKETSQRLRFTYDSPPKRMTWVQEKGDIKSLSGSWVFEELAPDRTRATFALEADPGRMLGMLLRGPVEGKVKEYLTRGAAEGLKQHLESS